MLLYRPVKLRTDIRTSRVARLTFRSRLSVIDAQVSVRRVSKRIYSRRDVGGGALVCQKGRVDNVYFKNAAGVRGIVIE